MAVFFAGGLFLYDARIVLPVLLSIVAVIILAFPIIRELKLDVFEPVVFFTASFLFGGVFRTVYLVSSGSGSILTYGVKYPFLIYSLILSIVGFLAIQLGYSSGICKNISLSVLTFSDKYWDSRRLWYVVGILTLTGIISYIVFLNFTGGLPTSIIDISRKRHIQNGYVRWGVELLYISFILVFTHYLKSGFSVLSVKGFFLLFVFFLALSFPFLTSNRGNMLTLVLLTLFIYHYYRRRIRVGNLIIFILILAIIVVVMGGLRRASWQGLEGFYRYTGGGFMGGFRRIFIEGHYLFDITTFARILQDVPGKMDFQWGGTLVNWLFWPVPRSLWPNKPVNLGQRIGAQIYNQGVGVVGAGVPPPFIAELYLNFHIYGILIGMFIFGIVSKSLYLHLLQNRHRVTTVLIYAIVLNSLWSLFQGNLTKVVVGFLQWMVPLGIALHVITHGKLVRFKTSNKGASKK